VIISTDSDFYQLIAPNVSQYNGVQEHHITHEGVFDKKGKIVIDNKTKEPKAIPDPKWLLFEKCIRGDSSDNVFSAYPKVRVNKLQEAFKDRDSQGFAWNNLMLQRWVDHHGAEHRVKDDYERNRQLIDLAAQPSDIKDKIIETIKTNIDKEKNVGQVGIRLLKFCQLYDLKKISDQAQQYAEPLNARYHK
jgi:5'-3' exonuclease